MSNNSNIMKASEIVEQVRTGFMFDNKTKLPEVKNFININPESIKIPFSKYKTKLYLLEMDTISAVKKLKGAQSQSKLCVLNFASFKEAGGRFRQGKMEQEEHLCHHTNLYNNLFSCYTWYAQHESTLNNGMYQNESILSENITLMREDLNTNIQSSICTFDVLSCAAPNKSPLLKYKQYLCDKCDEEMELRCDYVLRMMCNKEYDAIILGAFGCGVFKNNPHLVSQAFLKLLRGPYKGAFKNVVFAIPSGENYNIFKETFTKK